MRLAPILLFTYNRLLHTKQTVEALKKNKLADRSDLIIFSDGAKGEQDAEQVSAVRDFLKTVDGFKSVEIIKRNKNLGLANSIINGVSLIIKQYGSVIVLEDDILTSPAFLTFMNTLLNRYEDNKQVYSITGYNHPQNLMRMPKKYPYDIYFNPRAGSWSWGTWKDRWEKADWEIQDFNSFIKNKASRNEFNQGGDDLTITLKQQMEGKIDSWAIRWCYALFKNDALCIYPSKSYVDNIGLDGSGVHCGNLDTNKYRQQELNRKFELSLPSVINTNEDIMTSFKGVYKINTLVQIYKKVKLFIRNIYE